MNLKDAASTLVVSGLLFVVSISAWGTNINVPCVDNSPAGSPLHSSGSTVLAQNEVGNQVSFQYHDDWTTTSVSTKPIMAIVETLSIRFPNGHLAGKTLAHEAFFHPHLVLPGETIRLIPPNDESPKEVMPIGNEQSAEPICAITTRWVQYVDGSTFGDQTYAAHLLQLRHQIWDALAYLNHVYLTQGADKFAAALMQPTHPAFVDGYLDHLRLVQKEEGTQVALERLRAHLQMAEERTAAMTSH